VLRTLHLTRVPLTMTETIGLRSGYPRDKARSEQPHYVAPIVTTHVLLVQQYRYDSSWQTNSDGSRTDNYGNGRGLEIVPNTRMEVQIAPPPYIVHSGNISDGNGDTSLFVKFRAFSAPEGKGDYFVGMFLGASFPSGSPPNGLGHTVLSPMLALAKGWGPVNIQNTFSGSLPTSGTNVLGRAFLWNTAFEYSIKGKIWPMIEQNSTFFSDGPGSGKKQTFLTPGVVFGMFQIAERLRFGIGGGVQIAATQFHTYDHRWIWTVRFPFKPTSASSPRVRCSVDRCRYADDRDMGRTFSRGKVAYRGVRWWSPEDDERPAKPIGATAIATASAALG